MGLNEGNIGRSVCPGFGKSTYGASLARKGVILHFFPICLISGNDHFSDLSVIGANGFPYPFNISQQAIHIRKSRKKESKYLRHEN